MRLDRRVLNTPRLRHVAKLELWCAMMDSRTFDRGERYRLAAMQAAKTAQQAQANGFPDDANELAAVCIAFLKMCDHYDRRL